MIGKCVLVLMAVIVASVVPATAAELDSAIAAERAGHAARYMVAAERPDGAFHYEYDFLSGDYSDDDNLVRQAGGGFALGEYYARTADATVRARLERALTYYERQSAFAGDGRIVSSSGLWVDGNTGATALALLAELHYFDATGDQRFASIREGWILGLAEMQRPGGGFARAPGSDEESVFYNGESWLALALAAQLFPDHAVVSRVLTLADGYMIETYAADPETGFAHWGLMAAALRFETTADDRFGDFLVQVAEIFTTKMRPEVRPNVNSCSSVEGIGAAARALHLADWSPELVARLADRAQAELAKSIDLQILPDQTRIAFGPDRSFADARLPSFAGAFLNGRYQLQTRIDFTQHCLSALLKYQALQVVLAK
jgi:hypothetical protein